MAKKGFQELRVYQLAEQLADNIWKIVEVWEPFAKDTVGKQIVRSVDSIGANIAEGVGRGSYQDNRRFFEDSKRFFERNTTLVETSVLSKPFN